MKTKLLKKIRKRFSWTRNKNGDYYIVDNYKEIAIFVDDALVKKEMKGDEEPACGKEEYKLRCFKAEILKPFYSNPIELIMYRGLRANIKKRNRK